MIMQRFGVRHALCGAVGVWLSASCLPVLAQFPDAPRNAFPPLPERQAAVLKEFDKDGNGHLDATERESARKAWAAKQLAQRGDRGFFRPPPELLEEFDADKDGELDDQEGRTAMETMGKRFEKMQKDYDTNTNGRLDPSEIASAAADIDVGKLKGIPKMFLQFAAGPRGRPGRPGGPGPGPEQDGDDAPDPAEVIRSADKDKNGRLSSEEKELVRAEWSKRRAARPSGNPAPASPAATPTKP
jgi:hypothetical protein